MDIMKRIRARAYYPYFTCTNESAQFRNTIPHLFFPDYQPALQSIAASKVPPSDFPYAIPRSLSGNKQADKL
jgi:hypothetical protein